MRLIDADNEILNRKLSFYRYYTGIDEAPYEYASRELDNVPTVPAIPISVIKQIKAEIEERKLKSGGEPNRDLAFNVCLGIIDHHIKEYTE